MEEPVRVLVVGDGDASVALLGAVASRRPTLAISGPAAIGDAASVVARERPHVVMLHAPASSVAGALTEIRRGDAHVRILVDGRPRTRELAATVIAAGGCGVLPESLAPSAVVEAVVRAAAGELVLDDRDLHSLVSELAARPRPTARATLLTNREQEVLQALSDGLATTEISLRLGIRPATVQSHVKSTLAKLGAHSKVEAMRIAWREGVIAVPA